MKTNDFLSNREADLSPMMPPVDQKAVRNIRSWAVFGIGVAVWPLIWALEFIYKKEMLESRDWVDYFAFAGATPGFLCCVVAPFQDR